MSSNKIEFKFIGHATLLIKYRGCSLITDPWFGHSFHLNSFYHKGFLPLDTDEITDIDAIHISHIHQDHLNLDSLKLFPRGTPIYIAKHVDKKFYNRICELGFTKVYEFTPWTETAEVGPFKLNFFTPKLFNGSFDSSLMLDVNGKQFYLMNDCILDQTELQAIKEKYKNIQGSFLGYVGSNPSPTCYDFQYCKDITVTMAELLLKREEFYLNYVTKIAESFATKWNVLYANDIRFKDAYRAIHNRIFQSAIRTPLGDNIFKLNPGDKIDAEGTVTFNSAQILSPEYSGLSGLETDSFRSNNSYQKIFYDYLSRNSKEWKSKMNVEFSIISGNESKRFMFSCQTGLVEAQSFCAERHLLVEYPIKAVHQVMDSKWLFRSVHYAFLFKTVIFRRWAEQQRVQNWN